MDFIKTSIPTSVDDSVSSLVKQAIGIFTPYAVPLTPEERSGKRTMGLGREGHANLINKIVLAHPDSLPRKDDPQKLNNQLQLDSRLENLRQYCMKMLELINDTQYANSADIMKTTDSFAASLQNARKDNSALDMGMKEVDEFNRKYAGSGGATDTAETATK